MRTFYYLTIFIFSFLACSNGDTNENTNVPNPDSDTETTITTKSIKVLSYNIHHCNPPSKPNLIDLDATAKIITDSEADIVGLQEVDVNTKRSGTTLNMAKKLAELAGYPYFYFSKGINFQGGEYGTAILSKYPLSETQTILLPKATGTEQRTLSLVTVTVDEKTKFYFGNVHLDFTNEESNLNQAKFLTTYFNQFTNANLPSIIVGDFNATPDSKSIQQMNLYFKNSCVSNCGFTHPETNPTKTIDYIFYKTAKDFEVKSTEVVQESYASDHLPIKAHLLLRQTIAN